MQKAVFIGVFVRALNLPAGVQATQKGRRGSGQKIFPTRPSQLTGVKEPEAGRTIQNANEQSPKRGRNPRPCGHGRHQCEGRRVRNQAPERVINEHHGQAGLRLPFRFTANPAGRLIRGKRECLFLARGRQQAVGALLIN